MRCAGLILFLFGLVGSIGLAQTLSNKSYMESIQALGKPGEAERLPYYLILMIVSALIGIGLFRLSFRQAKTTTNSNLNFNQS